MREHRAKIELPLSPEAAFALLVTPTDIRRWWGASRVIVLPEEGGLWVGAWGEDENRPDYISAARLAVYDPPRRLVMDDFHYRAREEGPVGFDTSKLATEFRVEAAGAGSRLTVLQTGFPDGPEADAFYAGCEKGWHETLASLAAYVREQSG